MSNENMAAQWSAGADGWVAHEQRFDQLYRAATDAILAAADIRSGHRVLDVGCGTGTLTQAAVELGAEAVGLDISPTMTEAARRRVPRALVVTGDAQSLDLLAEIGGRPFDRVVSRFGTMFFDDPVVAFRRLHGSTNRGTTSSGSLTFVCWRTLAENPTFTLGTQIFIDRLPELGHQPPGAPGPMALSDPDRLVQLLVETGWSGVEVDPLDFDCDYGTGEAAVEERLAIIMATTVGRKALAQLSPALGPDRWSDLLDEVRDQIRSASTNGRLSHPAATWLVRASS